MSMLMASYQISVVNNITQATPTNFQQFIQTTLQYPSGVRFWSPIDGWLYGWLESLSSTNQANIWVKIPSSIPANGVYQIYMIENSSLNFDGNYWGEAPTLSSSYAQYDNGANMFNFYDNFAGTSLNTNKWTQVGTGYSINNGFIFQTPGTATDNNYLQSVSSFSLPIITEAYIYPTNGGWIGFSQIGTYSNGGVLAYYYPNQYGWQLTQGSIQLNYTGDDAENTYYIMSETMLPGGTALLSVNYVNLITSSSGYFSGTTGNLYIGDNGGTGTMYWIRTRAYPPNGVMPETAIVPLQAWKVFVPPLP